jgi:ribose 5-phosphate isomerase RpiB
MRVIIALDHSGLRLKEKVRKIITAWLDMPFSGEKRHKRRINKIGDYERKR